MGFLNPKNVDAYLQKPVVFFDLDGTLLDTYTISFLSRTAKAILKRFYPFYGKRNVLFAIKESTRAVFDNSLGSGKNNYEVMLESALRFSRNKNRDDMEQALWDFYRKDYPALGRHCRPIPGARKVVETLHKRGKKICLVTNPIWPLEAVEERVRWGGVDPGLFHFKTHSQIMHSCKPKMDFYQEVLNQQSLRPSDILYFGDSWKNDYVAKEKLGITTRILPKDPSEGWKALLKVLGV